MIVILIIGVLSAVIVPKIIAIDKRAKERATLANLKAIRKALELYRADNNGILPVDLTDFRPLVPKYLPKSPYNRLNPYPDKSVKVWWIIGNISKTTCDAEWKTHVQSKSYPNAPYGWIYLRDNNDHIHQTGGICEHGYRLITIGYPDGTDLDCDGRPYYEW